MLVTLPVISFFLLLFLIRKKGNPWPNSAMAAAVAWGTLLTGTTEALSFLDLLTFPGVFASWFLANILLSFALLVVVRKGQPRADRGMTRAVTPLVLSLLLLTLIIVPVGINALVAPPNNWDSMTYHMSRVAHWVQNGNVNHYPTHILRQLYLGPGAEFIILHFQILSSGDRFANLVQWLSMVGCIGGVSLLAQQLGANTTQQALAAVICATIPIGILEASSTQNDYVVSFWLVCLVYFALRWRKQPTESNSLGVGASLGLSLLTKATAYLYAPPFLVWFFLSGLITIRAKVWKHVLLVFFMAALINSGHYARNYDLFGHPLNPGKGALGYEVANETISFQSVSSNFVRNMALQAVTPSPRLRRYTDDAVLLAHSYFGGDLNDPRTTFLNSVFSVPKFSFHEDVAGNPIHLVLIALAVIVFFLFQKPLRSPDLFAYAISIIGAFLLLCVYLKWTPFNSRYHLPLLVLWSPFIAVVLSRRAPRLLGGGIATVLIVTALPFVCLNKSRPLIGEQSVFSLERNLLYFSNRPELFEPYVRAADTLRSRECSQIGMLLGEDDYEYPLWVLLKTRPGIGLGSVNVANVSAVKGDMYPFRDFDPPVIVAVEATPVEVLVRERTYENEWSFGPIKLFRKRKGF
jgi:hypothetical protein